MVTSRPPAAVSRTGANLSSRYRCGRQTTTMLRGPRARWERRFRPQRGVRENSTRRRRSQEIAEAIARLVRTWVHGVPSPGDGPSGLALAEAFQPECAIVDLSLPGMNGFDVAHRLRERFPRPQPTDRSHRLRGRGDRRGVPRRGFDVHLVKPGEIPVWRNCSGTSARILQP